MPSKNKAQHNLMAMVAHDPAAAKRLGIPQKVGKEFMDADKGRKFSRGGEMKKMGMKKMSGGGATAMGKVTAGGKRAHGEHTVQERGHTKGKQIVMAGGKGMKKGGKAC